MILNSVIFDVAKKNMTKTLNIESEIFFIIALPLTAPAVFNLKIQLVKIPEAAGPLIHTAPPDCV
jgi:hypothetical protein